MLKILPFLICCCPCPAGHGLCAAGPCDLCPCPSLPSSRASDGRVLVWTWPWRECSCHRDEQMLNIRACVCMWVLFLGSQLWNIKQPSWLYPGFFLSPQLPPLLPSPTPPDPYSFLPPTPPLPCHSLPGLSGNSRNRLSLCGWRGTSPTPNKKVDALFSVTLHCA